MRSAKKSAKAQRGEYGRGSPQKMPRVKLGFVGVNVTVPRIGEHEIIVFE